VVLTLVQTECDKDITAVHIMYGVQKHGAIRTRCQTSGTTGRLSFSCLEALSVLPSADYGQHPVASSEIFPSLGVGGQQKVKYDDFALPK
jgi:hypothetical protein